MEHGGAKHHRERMGEAIREELVALLEGELADPRIGLVSVSEVQLAPDGRSARVFVTVDGEAEDVAQTLDGLNNARTYIRRELAARLHLRQAPEITFTPDVTMQHAGRIEELLKRIKKRNR